MQTATDPGLVLGKGEGSGSRVAPSRSVFKICVRAGVRLCSALCSKMSAVLEGRRCWSICEYLAPESESRQAGIRNMFSSVRGNTFEVHGNPVFECVLCSRATKIYIYIIYIHI